MGSPYPRAHKRALRSKPLGRLNMRHNVVQVTDDGIRTVKPFTNVYANTHNHDRGIGRLQNGPRAR